MPNGEETEEGEVPKGPGRGGGRGRETLEERVSIFDSIGNSIDSLVKTVEAIPKVVKEAAYYTYYAAKATAGLAVGVALAGAPALIGAPVLSPAAVTSVIKMGYHALILPVGIAAGTLLANWKNKEKKTFKEKYKQIANELAVGGLLGGFLQHIFSGSRYLISSAKSAYGTLAGLLTGAGCAVAQLPPFLATHEYLNRALISDYKPKPFDIGKKLKGPMKWLIPPLIANFTVVPAYLGENYQMPVAAGIATAYGTLKTEPKKKEEKKEATAPQLPQGAYQPSPG